MKLPIELTSSGADLWCEGDLLICNTEKIHKLCPFVKTMLPRDKAWLHVSLTPKEGYAKIRMRFRPYYAGDARFEAWHAIGYDYLYRRLRKEVDKLIPDAVENKTYTIYFDITKRK